MFLPDYHMHSHNSPDAFHPLHEMVEAGIHKGLSHICITEHCDLIHPTSAKYHDLCLDMWENYKAEFAAAKEKYSSQIDLRMGLELGESNQLPELARSVAAYPELDFILGTLHSLRNTLDFYQIIYENKQQCQDYVSRYLDELLEIAQLGLFDVMAHIGYTRRYMIRQGFDIGLDGFEDKLRALFKILIDSGKGIEVNTSGLRDQQHSTIPEYAYIKLYRDCGGEIITLGSDSHRPQDVGAGIPEARQLLLDAGFQYFTVFEKRKPEFIKL